MRKRDEKKNRREIVTALSMIFQIGLSTMTCMAMSFGIGYYIDKLFGSKWGVPVFLVIGIMAAIRSMLVLNGKYFPTKKNEIDEKGNEDGNSRK